MYRRKSPIGPFGCLFAILYFPLGVILELAKGYGGSGRRGRRRR